MSNRQDCPLCQASAARFHVVATIEYFECRACDFIFADKQLLLKMDSGEPVRAYDNAYWEMEIPAAEERCFGPAIARVAEALLYARRPVTRFLDIGTGTGRLLDALSVYLPSSKEIFHGVELFPPPPERRSTHPNYHVGSVASLGMTFDGGCCIEVIEHLTPKMLAKLASELAAVSEPSALYIFNTGLTKYVKMEDIAYLDPIERGHVCIWSVKSVARVFEPNSFTVLPIPGKTWAFVIEYQPAAIRGDVRDRIWTAHEWNKKILHDPRMGSVLYCLALDTARAYQ
jgi:hypothetical protein